MWHAESLARAKKMPQMRSYFYKEKKPERCIDEAGIMVRLKSYNNQLEKKKTS